jgi:hypothetical protein
MRWSLNRLHNHSEFQASSSGQHESVKQDRGPGAVEPDQGRVRCPGVAGMRRRRGRAGGEQLWTLTGCLPVILRPRRPDLGRLQRPGHSARLMQRRGWVFAVTLWSWPLS